MKRKSGGDRGLTFQQRRQDSQINVLTAFCHSEHGNLQFNKPTVLTLMDSTNEQESVFWEELRILFRFVCKPHQFFLLDAQHQFNEEFLRLFVRVLECLLDGKDQLVAKTLGHCPASKRCNVVLGHSARYFVFPHARTHTHTHTHTQAQHTLSRANSEFKQVSHLYPSLRLCKTTQLNTMAQKHLDVSTLSKFAFWKFVSLSLIKRKRWKRRSETPMGRIRNSLHKSRIVI